MASQTTSNEWQPFLGAGLILGIGIGGLALLSYFAGGVYSEFAEVRVEAGSQRARSSAKQVEAEHWAGTYQSFIGELVLGTENFTFTEQHSCGVVPVGRDFGTVHEQDGILHFDYFYGDVNRFMRSVYFPIDWKDRSYLVGEEDLPEFCSFVNGAAHFRLGLFSKKSEPGRFVDRPIVPAEYEPYLLSKPVHLRVSECGEYEPGKVVDSYGLTRVTLDAGQAQGILEGMRVSRCGSPFTELTIESSTEHQSIGVLQHSFDESQPEVGWCFTTGGRESECLQAEPDEAFSED